MMLSKSAYGILLIKVSAIDIMVPNTSGLVTKTPYYLEKQGLEENIEEKLPNKNGLIKKTDCNTSITEIVTKIPSVTGLVNTVALNTQNPQRLKQKYLMPKILLLLLSSTDSQKQILNQE